MYEEMHNPHIDDDAEFTYGGTGRYFIKITPELLAWSRNILANMELLSSAKHWVTIKEFNARLKAITLPPEVEALKAKQRALREQQDALPGGERSVTHDALEIELECMPLVHEIQMAYARMELEKAKVREEWDEERARMLAATTAEKRKTKQTKLVPCKS